MDSLHPQPTQAHGDPAELVRTPSVVRKMEVCSPAEPPAEPRPLRLAVLGATGHGKSTLVKAFYYGEPEDGPEVMDRGADVDSALGVGTTVELMAFDGRVIRVNGIERKLVLIDTPGIGTTNGRSGHGEAMNLASVLGRLHALLARSEESEPVHGILLVVSATDNQFQLSGQIIGEYLRRSGILSPTAGSGWQSLIVVGTMADQRLGPMPLHGLYDMTRPEWKRECSAFARRIVKMVFGHANHLFQNDEYQTGKFALVGASAFDEHLNATQLNVEHLIQQLETLPDVVLDGAQQNGDDAEVFRAVTASFFGTLRPDQLHDVFEKYESDKAWQKAQLVKMSREVAGGTNFELEQGTILRKGDLHDGEQRLAFITKVKMPPKQSGWTKESLLVMAVQEELLPPPRKTPPCYDRGRGPGAKFPPKGNRLDVAWGIYQHRFGGAVVMEGANADDGVHFQEKGEASRSRARDKTLKRAKCLGCGKEYTVKKDGTLREHNCSSSLTSRRSNCKRSRVLAAPPRIYEAHYAELE